MNYKIYIHGLLPALCSFLLFSCSQENQTIYDLNDDSEIIFNTSLPAVETRADTVSGNIQKDGFIVTALIPEDDNPIVKNKTYDIGAYFSDQLVTKNGNNGSRFKSDVCRWPTNAGTNNGTLRFFAYYPTKDVMLERVGTEANGESFKFTNNSQKKISSSLAITYLYNYNIEGFTISTDISRHVDFLVATQDGSKNVNLYSGVDMYFVHPLTSIELQAWGNSPNFDIEIAGVRLGGVSKKGNYRFPMAPVTTGNYTINTATMSNTSTTASCKNNIGAWSGHQTTDTKGDVEYIYQEGDTVVQIGSEKHNSSKSAISIMGKGGDAIVLPSVSTLWTSSTDPKNTKKGRYISVLLRVKDKYGLLMYPYINGTVTNNTTSQSMNVIYLAVEKSTGKVLKRVYKNGKEYYTDPEFSELYSIPSDAEVRDYGWAAISYGPVCNAGNKYTYILNYTNAIGVEDPKDPNPGKPIISEITPTVTSVEDAPDIEIENFDDGAIWDVSGELIIE